jgi:hypothetical protein
MNFKKVIKAIIATTALAIVGVGAPVVATSSGSASTASAAVIPVIYNYASGWNNAMVKPQWIIIGQGGSPMAHTWHWNTWGPKTATSAGTLWTNNCVPDCAQGKTSYHKLYVTLYWVKSHNGQPYFYGMKWYAPGYKMKLHGYWSSTTYWHFINGFWR